MSCSIKGTAHFSLYPTLMGSKTPTSKFSESKKVRWGMKKTPLIKVSLYFFKGVTVQYVITRQTHSNGPILKIFIQITLKII
ncbi:hypothetical protein FHY73_20670 [Bacillus tropicus]|nr:hypothetical protein FHY73_20670 [Bacillus tropicus]